jgi:hypothetical protein
LIKICEYFNVVFEEWEEGGKKRDKGNCRYVVCSDKAVYCDMDGVTGGGGRVNSVDSRGDVTYPHSFHQYTALSKHSPTPAVT